MEKINTKKTCCPYYSKDGICLYQKGLFSSNQNSLCSALDRKDYQTFKSSYWFPKKRELSLKSTCPLVGVFWIEKKLSFSTIL